MIVVTKKVTLKNANMNTNKRKIPILKSQNNNILKCEQKMKSCKNYNTQKMIT